MMELRKSQRFPRVVQSQRTKVRGSEKKYGKFKSREKLLAISFEVIHFKVRRCATILRLHIFI